MDYDDKPQPRPYQITTHLTNSWIINIRISAKMVGYSYLAHSLSTKQHSANYSDRQYQYTFVRGGKKSKGRGRGTNGVKYR